MHRLEISFKTESHESEINIGKGIRHDLGQLISNKSTLNPRRIGIVSNKRVYGLYGRDINRSLKRQKLKVLEWLMPEGERFKSISSLEQVLKFLGESGFERNDLVVALGGGVVGDLAGFSAAVYLRGIPIVQIPTTLLAQIDSSVGGKTGVNLQVGKNLVGAFHQPASVLIDTETLTTLPQRELVSGFCEMVKQSLVSDRLLFNRTVGALKNRRAQGNFLVSEEIESLISAHCGFKASIVADDERESTGRTDGKSRKILNFGHTTAHALETITNYRLLRHGEAVGHGMLVAGELSRNLGLLSETELELIREAVQLCGPLPRVDHLEVDRIIDALKHDKKSVRGQINWVLLEGLGSPKIVDGKLISNRLLRLSLREGLKAPVKQKERSLQ
jgi:3-dehydroquinate synthase